VKLPRDSRRYRAWTAFVGLAGAALIRSLGATWRISTEGPDPFQQAGPVVGALWHQGMLVAAYRWRGRGLAVPVSQSRDGELIAAVLRRLGFGDSPRGSSSRGASGLLRSLIRATRAGTVVAILPDGPRGPARAAKPGVLALASATGAALVPVGVAARPSLHFGSWDRALLPLPFARVRCVYGTPLFVPKKTGDLESWRKQLEATLDRMTEAAERGLGGGAVGGTPGDPPA
jgi:lysophospholipid acyltransferase (LPLAT)-like uncharacterized protein